MRLKNPEFLYLLLIWIPMIWIYLRRERRSRPTVRFSDLSLIRSLPRSPRVWLRHSIPILRMIGIGLIAVALARPQQGRSEEEVTTEGVDIMLALDVSTSMKALDFQPENRLVVAKRAMQEFVRKREHDRIGLVVYAGRAYTRCPLTLDYNLLTQFIEELRFGDIEDGTAIGTAIATAANRLKDSPAKSKVLILATDGANNKGEIAPLTAAKAATELGIKIYTIGVGREGKVPYPFEVVNPWTGERSTRVEMVDSDLDEPLLREIARISGGTFWRARDAKSLEEVYATIDKLEKTEIKTMSYTTYADLFFPWLVWAAVVLMIEMVLSHTIFRRIP